MDNNSTHISTVSMWLRWSFDKVKMYPIRCVDCMQKQVRPAFIRHELKNSDGTSFVMEKLPVNRCQSCGEIYFTNDSDQAITNCKMPSI